MIFRGVLGFIICSLLISLFSCSDAENETNLINLHTAASQDIISIQFPADSTETILSINSEFDFSLQGLKSNGVDLITLTDNIRWSLSDGALSTIDQQGRFSASATAELITLSAQFGHLIESIEIKVSAAKFDQVVQLDKQAFNINRCQSKIIKPVARYVDENGNDEIRAVDSTIINTIEWIIREQADNSPSKRAHIETIESQARLRTLAASDIIIQAKAMSVFSGTVVTSIDFNQSIGNALNSIKLCESSATDLNSCVVNSANLEQDKSLALIAVANYQASDGSNFNENISNNSKWGIDNPTNASIALSGDRQSLIVTGKTENTNALISTACGDIAQSIDGIDISGGVVLSSSVSCSNSIDCLAASATISIDLLSVTSFDVSANDIDLIDSETLTLNARPDEITLIVKANFSNSSSLIITDDSGLVYSITAGDAVVIEDKADSPGVFTVLGNGTAKIKLDYRGETFIVSLAIP